MLGFRTPRPIEQPGGGTQSAATRVRHDRASALPPPLPIDDSQALSDPTALDGISAGLTASLKAAVEKPTATANAAVEIADAVDGGGAEDVEDEEEEVISAATKPPLAAPLHVLLGCAAAALGLLPE